MESEHFEKDADEYITGKDVIRKTETYNSEDNSMLEHPDKVIM